MKWLIKDSDQVIKEGTIVLAILCMVCVITYMYTKAKDIEVPFKENTENNKNYIIPN